MRQTGTLYLLLLAVGLCCSQIYVDDGIPYEPGPFPVDTAWFSVLLPGEDQPEYHSKTFYPVANDTFGVYYFITGFFGTGPSGMYSDLFTQMAAHGYVIFSTWIAQQGASVEQHLQHIEWLRENVPGQLGGAMPSFDHMTISCHSAGCAPHIKLMVNYTEMWMASVNFDPSTFAIDIYDLDVGVPVLNLGTEFGTITPNGTCVFPTLDYLAWHEKSLCPRIAMEAERVGHCEPLDEEFWQDCAPDCGGPPSYIAEFKNILKGNAVAFTNAYVQGNMDQLKYVSDPELIPWNMLTFLSDVDC